MQYVVWELDIKTNGLKNDNFFILNLTFSLKKETKKQKS